MDTFKIIFDDLHKHLINVLVLFNLVLDQVRSRTAGLGPGVAGRQGGQKEMSFCFVQVGFVPGHAAPWLLAMPWHQNIWDALSYVFVSCRVKMFLFFDS